MLSSFYEGDAIGAEYARSLMDELTEEGVLVRDEEGKYALSDPERGRFDFSM